MYVDTAKSREIKEGLGENSSIGCDYDHVGLPDFDGFERFLIEFFWLQQGEVVLESCFFDRTCLKGLVASDWSIGSRDHPDDIVLISDEGLEYGLTESGGSHEDEADLRGDSFGFGVVAHSAK